MPVDAQIRRRELKFLVDLPVLEAFHDQVKEVLVPDRHGANGDGYFNYSIYFDSPKYLFYHQKVEGLSLRTKPRLRVYKESIDGAPTARFFEFKNRDAAFVSKDRVPISDPLSEKLLRSGNILDDPEVQASEHLQRFGYLRHRLGLRPTMVTLYHRFPFFCALQNDLRITYDKRIQCSQVIGLDLAPEQFHYVEPPNRALIEIKFNTGFPDWLLRITKSLQFQQLSFSKYVESMERSQFQAHRRVV